MLSDAHRYHRPSQTTEFLRPLLVLRTIPIPKFGSHVSIQVVPLSQSGVATPLPSPYSSFALTVLLLILHHSQRLRRAPVSAELVLSLQPCSESVPRREEHKRKAKIRKSKLCPWPGSRFAVSSDRRGPIIATHSRTQGARYPRYVRAHYSISPPLVHSEEASRSCTYRHSTFSTINRTRSRRFSIPPVSPASPVWERERDGCRLEFAANLCTWSASDIFRTTCTAMAQRSASVRTLPPVRAIIQESATGFGRTELPSRMQTWT